MLSFTRFLQVFYRAVSSDERHKHGPFLLSFLSYLNVYHACAWLVRRLINNNERKFVLHPPLSAAPIHKGFFRPLYHPSQRLCYSSRQRPRSVSMATLRAFSSSFVSCSRAEACEALSLPRLVAGLPIIPSLPVSFNSSSSIPDLASSKGIVSASLPAFPSGELGRFRESVFRARDKRGAVLFEEVAISHE